MDGYVYYHQAHLPNLVSLPPRNDTMMNVKPVNSEIIETIPKFTKHRKKIIVGLKIIFIIIIVVVTITVPIAGISNSTKKLNSGNTYEYLFPNLSSLLLQAKFFLVFILSCFKGCGEPEIQPKFVNSRIVGGFSSIPHRYIFNII
jgi:hypothetical protein